MKGGIQSVNDQLLFRIAYIYYYRVSGDTTTGYDLGVGMGTYSGYVHWVRVRCAYATGTVRVGYTSTVRVRVRYGYGTPIGYRHGVASYPLYLFLDNAVLFPKCATISATFSK